jgi:hypothetical protein
MFDESHLLSAHIQKKIVLKQSIYSWCYDLQAQLKMCQYLSGRVKTVLPNKYRMCEKNETVKVKSSSLLPPQKE